MALIDAQLELSDNQDATSDAASTNVIDLGVNADHGVGNSMRVVATVGTAFAGGTNVVTFVEVSDDNSTFRTLVQTAAIVTASLTAGAKILDVALPPAGAQAGYRYLRLRYDVTGTFSAGTVNAYLVMDAEDHANG